MAVAALTIVISTAVGAHLTSPEEMLASQPHLLDAQKGSRQGERSVLLVGNPALPLKGFDVAIAVLSMVNRVLPLDITWICQTQPTAAMVPGLATSGLRINLHISPAQVWHH